ncbi:MAG TPA: four-carbon acid sugar kinase family protein, partial [Micrococcaceae bacterium]|nr:four-carbon acid sugar kinase family protein [Micrococcaceae bacterium]
MNSSTGQGDASLAPESGPPTGPAIREIPDARARIRAGRAAVGGRIAVLDDDPTGSQSVYGVSVVTVLEAAEYEAALTEPGSTCFILTNTRSLDQDDAVALNTEAGRALFELERRLSAPLDIISRSDSTLRGHVVAEVRALDKVRREVLGRGFDGVLLVPSFFEAGRFTAGDIHWAMVDGKPEPVGKTEFARDATFGYASSDLKDFISEKSAGTITAGNVLSLGLDDIRTGGVDRVAEILRSASDLQFIAVNATEYADLEIVVLGLAEVQKEGKRYLYRTGP